MEERNFMQETGQNKMHEHVLGDGTVLSHSHGHVHSHTQTKQVLKRINNIIGHMQGISSMVVEERDCSDVLIQLSAVSSAVRKLKVMILQDHIAHCIVDAVQQNDQKSIQKLNEAIDKLVD